MAKCGKKSCSRPKSMPRKTGMSKSKSYACGGKLKK